jgi:hypothetical protein
MERGSSTCIQFGRSGEALLARPERTEISSRFGIGLASIARERVHEIQNAVSELKRRNNTDC